MKFAKFYSFYFVAWLCLFCHLIWGIVEGSNVQKDLSLTYQEKLALDEFKARMAPHLPHSYMKQEIYLIRWLRARNLNIQQAEQMLLENLRWRKETKMDTINSEDWSDMLDEYESDTNTVDKKGRPIGEAHVGQWNIRKAALTGNMRRFCRYLNKLQEEVTQKVIMEQCHGMNVTRWKFLFNLEGFNVVQHACPLCLACYVQFALSYEQRYPLLADAVIFVNAPPSFQIILDAVRPVLVPETRESLKVFTSNKKQWMEYLDREISPKQRKAQYGGVLGD